MANPAVHSRLSIVNAAHQWVSSQLDRIGERRIARRVELHLHERGPAAGEQLVVLTPVQVGALMSLSGVHGACG